jgi:hypothetical protein
MPPHIPGKNHPFFTLPDSGSGWLKQPAPVNPPHFFRNKQGHPVTPSSTERVETCLPDALGGVLGLRSSPTTRVGQGVSEKWEGFPDLA